MENETNFIESLKNGKEMAYSILVEHYHHQLCVYAHSLMGDQEMARDIVQNVFFRMWKKRHKLDANSSLKSFLYKSVYNEFIDQYRKNKSVISLEKKHIEVLDDFIEKDEDTVQKLFDMVQREIRNLPPKSRMVFMLSKQEGLTNMEIAEYLGVSLKSVEAHITKAFSLIRTKLNGKIKTEVLLFFLFEQSLSISNRSFRPL